MSIHALEKIKADAVLPEEVDVVIVGGGIIGITTALYLSEQGKRVCVCEKGRVGAEQSGRNWGWVRQMGREDSETPLSIKALELWRSFQKDYGIDASYRQTGITYLCRNEKEIKEAEGWAATGERYQIAQKFLRGREVAEFLPGLQPGFKAALHTSTDGRAEPSIATPAIARAAQKKGATIHEKCAVRGIETTGGRVSSVVTEIGEIKCGSVVVAGGAWSSLFLANIGIRFPQLKILVSVARAEGAKEVPNMPVGGGGFAYRPREDGGFSISLRGTATAPLTPDSFRYLRDFLPAIPKGWGEFQLRVGNQFVTELNMPRKWNLDDITPFEKYRILDPKPVKRYNDRALKNLKKVFPAFNSAKITHHWGGMIDCTPDFIPVIGEIPTIPGLFLSSGFSGHGFGIGPGAGLLTAQLVAGQTSCVDAKPFSLSRFE